MSPNIEKFSPEKREGGRIELRTFLNPPNDKYKQLIEIFGALHRRHEDKQDSLYVYKDDQEGYYAPYALRWISLFSDKYEDGTKKSSKTLEADTAVRAFFKNKLEGKILVDLGGGYGVMEKFAKKMGVSVYINVDRLLPGHQEAKPDSTIDLSKAEQSTNKTQVIEVKADILDFISRLPENSVNITINGMDVMMLDTCGAYADEYRDSLPDTVLCTGEGIKKVEEKKREEEKARENYGRSLLEEIIRVTEKGEVIFGSGTMILDEDDNRVYMLNPNETRVTEAKVGVEGDRRWEKKIFIKEF